MKRSMNGLLVTAALATIASLATSGCASKKYVSQQINKVNQQAAQHHKDTEGKLAWLTNKEQTDIAQVNDRIAATDQKAAEAAATAQAAQAAASAQGTAARSTEEATVEVTRMGTRNYQLVDKADVMFAFNKATLTPAAQSSLGQVAAKVQETPGAIVELAGFTDKVGSATYNLDLSRRRAWAVQRYLIEHNVPPRSIHVVGLGQEPPPEGMEAAVQVSHRRGDSGRNQAERRVNIRVFGTGDSAGTGGTDQ